MSHCTFWPGKTFFYPIGNTPPVCLSQNLAPEEKADVLFLGCGDPRSILFTVYATGLISETPRVFDITCCDIEAAVLGKLKLRGSMDRNGSSKLFPLARNILLLSFLIDEEDISLPNLSQIWNIFYNMYLDEDSLSLLFSQSRKLLDCSTTLDGWHTSKYGNILRMCTGNTLHNVRLIWSRYIGVSSMSANDRKDFERRFSAGIKSTKAKNMRVTFASHSAGPLLGESMIVLGEAFEEYARSGIITSDVDYRRKATLANPSLAYTALSGDKFTVHYATDPLSAFHLAEAFAPLASVRRPKTEKMTIQNVVDAVVSQFHRWCSAFVSPLRRQDRPGVITIRFVVADALSFCDALQYCGVTGDPATPLYTGPWRATTIGLSDDYGGVGSAPFSAPVKFNVIETSNLMNVGILNLLVSCCPLLQTTASATLFTEALGSFNENSLTALLDQACMSLSMLTLLLGLAPASCVTKYTTVSNAHEIIFHRATSSPQDADANSQFHERIAWKFATGSGGDSRVQRTSAFPDVSKLADALFNTYLKMFQNENPFSMRISRGAILSSNLIHYTRRSFAQLIGTAKRRIKADWPAVMTAFDQRVMNDRVLLLGSNYYQEMNCQFHILGVDTIDTLKPGYVQERQRQENSSTIFRGWASIPEVVCIALTVPRSAISRWEADLSECGTPVLLGNVKSTRSGFHNIFGCIHIVHGTLSTTGVGEHRRGMIQEDIQGFSGKSPMVATFLVPAWVLLFPEVQVSMSVLSTPAATKLVKKLGLHLQLFSADLSDKTHVHVFPERPDIRAEPTTLACMIGGRSCEADDSHIATVTLGSQSGEVDMLVVRADGFGVKAESALADGAAVSVVQHSPCTVELVIGTSKSLVRYPIPIDAAKARLRIARKSSYVEVIAPTALGTVGSKSSIGLFPLFRNGQNLAPWNIHQVHLDRLPALDITAPQRIKWISPLLGLTMSDRERTMPESESGIRADVLANLKESLASIILHSCGLGNEGVKRIFSLNDTSVGGYTLIFVADIRLDASTHSIVADAWVLPLTLDILPSIGKGLGALATSVVQIRTDTVEMHAWKRLLPAFVERCRTWTHKKNCPYLKQGPPLSLEVAESSICQCGAGVGAPGRFGKVEAWKPFMPYVTRAALSPLFASFMEPVDGQLVERLGVAEAARGSQAAVSGLGCAKCGKEGEKLLSCGRCKKVRYCGAECQRGHWKIHKVNCA